MQKFDVPGIIITGHGKSAVRVLPSLFSELGEMAQNAGSYFNGTIRPLLVISLPLVQLGLRADKSEEFATGPAKLVYRKNLRNPNDPVLVIRLSFNTPGLLFLFKDALWKLESLLPCRKRNRHASCTRPLIKVEPSWRPLWQPYQGPTGSLGKIHIILALMSEVRSMQSPCSG